MTESTRRAAWVEIDLAAAAANMRFIRTLTAPSVRLIAVVKADAYGHGAVRISRTLLDSGADMLAVATVDELLALRAAEIDAPILILGYVPDFAVEEVLAARGICTVYQPEQAEYINSVAARLKTSAEIHLKIDTGMARLGVSPDRSGVEAAARIAALPCLNISGMFSHFAASDEMEKSFAHTQLQRFVQFNALCRERAVNISLRHIANSAALLTMPEAHLDAARPGIILYGCSPSPEVQAPPQLKPVMSVKANIVRLHHLNAGESVSYGCTWLAEKDSLIATLPLGYADGVARALSNHGKVLLHGQAAPIVGRICMDQLMVDVTDVADVREGDTAVWLGSDGEQRISAEDIASALGTINYEVVCALGARLPKVYI